MSGENWSVVNSCGDFCLMNDARDCMVDEIDATIWFADRESAQNAADNANKVGSQ